MSDNINGASQQRHFPAPAAWLLIAAMVVLYSVSYSFSAAHTDTADEIWKAYQIHKGLDYPLQGPPLGQVLHAGPAWFYLTAIPLWIHSSWLTVAIFIGLVCSLKFPLAYLCGRALVGHDFGVWWALLLFVPGWTSFEQLIFLNPNGVAAASLAVALLSLKAIRGPTSALTFMVLGLAFSLAFHVHPNSSPAGALIAFALWAHHRRGGNALLAIPAAVLGAMIPLVPYLAFQVSSGFPDWQAVHGYVAGQLSMSSVVNVPRVLANYIVTGPRVVAEYVLGWSGLLAIALTSLLALPPFLGIAALARDSVFPIARKRAVQFVVAILAFAAWVAIMRPTTPLQFAWALAAPVAGFAALGAWRLSRHRPIRLTLFALATVLAGLNVVVMARFGAIVSAGEGSLPSRIMDIQGSLRKTIYRDVWLPATAHSSTGRFLCRDREPTALHGHLAYAMDKTLALSVLFECGSSAHLSLAASTAPRHLLGMTRSFWESVAAEPQCWLGPFGIAAAAEPLVPREPLAIATGARYLPRSPSGGKLQRVELEFRTGPGSIVMVTNVIGAYESFAVLGASVDGKLIAPAASNDLSVVFKAPASAAGHWKIELASSYLPAVEAVLVVAASKAASRCER